MDPLYAPLDESDLRVPEFPFAGGEDINNINVELQIAEDSENPELEIDSEDYLIGDWYKPTPGRPLHAVRCVATSRMTGQRCRRWSVIGFTKCPTHSGYGRFANLTDYRERVLERARLDLLRAAPNAVGTLTELSTDPEVAPSVRLKASTEILDRVGIRGGSELTLDARVEESATTAADEVRQRLARLAVSVGTPVINSTSASARTADGESEIVDAELVLYGDEEEEAAGDDDVAV